MFDLFFSHIVFADRFNSVAVAMVFVGVIGVLTGPLRGNANPFMWWMLDSLFGRLASKTYNVNRSVSSLRFRGAVLLTMYLLITGLLAAAALLIERRFGLGGFMDPFLLALTMSGGATWKALIKLHRALNRKEGLSKGSYYDVAVSTKSDLNSTDDHGIVRVGIGFVARSFDKGVVAPILWYLIAGLPGAFFYSGIAAARWSLSKDGFAKGIGTLALRLEELFGFFPQFLSAFILILAAVLTPKAGLFRSIIGAFKRGGAKYAEGGLPLTVMAYALHVSLGGPVQDVNGSVLKRGWVGSPNSTARAGSHHLRQAIYMGIMAFVLMFFFVVLGAVAWKMIFTGG